jgi:hypothetical protein
MAQIMLQRRVRVAIHARELLPEARNLGPERRATGAVP